jgi:hypothetical protein
MSLPVGANYFVAGDGDVTTLHGFRIDVLTMDGRRLTPVRRHRRLYDIRFAPRCLYDMATR